MKKWTTFAFLMGLTAELYVTIPFAGILPMLDLFSYFAAPFLIASHWHKMGANMRKTLSWAFSWTVAAIFAGMLSGASSHAVWKQIFVVSSSWSIMVVAWCILRNEAKLYLVYLIGYAVGAYVGIYYFKQGVWLAMEYMNEGRDVVEVMVKKQYYPIMANLVFYGGFLSFLLWYKKFPKFFIVIGCLFCAVFLLRNGGSRSHFGFYAMASMLAFEAASSKENGNNRGRNKGFAFAFKLFFTVAVIFLAYKYMAQSGYLGESESSKYQVQFIEKAVMDNGLVGRAGLRQSIGFFCQKPWGWGPYHGQHSVIMSAMNREGVIGLLTWIVFYSQLWWFVKNRLLYAGVYSPFLGLMLTNTAWACWGSPFGYRHTFFVLWAFIELCRDNPFYGVRTVFENAPIFVWPWRPVRNPSPDSNYPI